MRDGPLAPDGCGILRAYERYHTQSPKAAEAEAAALLSPHRLSVERNRAGFRALGRFADAVGVTLCHMSYGSEVFGLRADTRAMQTALKAPATSPSGEPSS